MGLDLGRLFGQLSLDLLQGCGEPLGPFVEERLFDGFAVTAHIYGVHDCESAAHAEAEADEDAEEDAEDGVVQWVSKFKWPSIQTATTKLSSVRVTAW